jgi:NAD(P)-dependent dehydrogenase (short-subunit alcohol dehydrogenase family)
MVDSFTGKLAVVTGGGSGMGRELVRQLAAQGCSVATCDWLADAAARTADTARSDAPPGVRVTSHVCDVSDEADSRRAQGLPEPEVMSHAQLEELIPPGARAGLIQAGLLTKDASAEDLRQLLLRIETGFRDKAPLSASDAATIILDGLRSGAWRILVGQDAKRLDTAVRAKPDDAYNYAELFRQATGSASDSA